MANMAGGKFGKDNPERFITGALTGGGGTSIKQGVTHSDDITSKSIGHGQSIMTATALDNVELALDVESSIRDEGGFRGGIDNIAHSLTGASAVNAEVGAAGSLDHQYGK